MFFVSLTSSSRHLRTNDDEGRCDSWCIAYLLSDRTTCCRNCRFTVIVRGDNCRLSMVCYNLHRGGSSVGRRMGHAGSTNPPRGGPNFGIFQARRGNIKMSLVYSGYTIFSSTFKKSTRNAKWMHEVNCVCLLWFWYRKARWSQPCGTGAMRVGCVSVLIIIIIFY